MIHFPAFFKLENVSVLVVGAGEVALRKVTLLERTGAHIRVVAPEAVPEIATRAAEGTLSLQLRDFTPADLDGVRLVIVATPRRAVNRWIATLSEARAIPVNVVDDGTASRFIVPAIVDRDPVVVAVSTGGASPVLARRLRERLEALIPQRFGELALWLRGLRRIALGRLDGISVRRRFFETLIDGQAARQFVDGDLRAARRTAQQLLAAAATAPPAKGSVTLVGAGPGDPELLTLKALRALQDADVIFHDRLVPSAVLDYARRDAIKVSVGKMSGGAGTVQEDINELLIEHARRGQRVVRLKGGDPFIFGRGGEELEALARAQVDFSVVPGITAALGAAAYAGIPLTHRELAHGVSFLTGHLDKNGHEPDWQSLAAPGMTAVFYMGLARLDHIVEQLLGAGAPSSRPTCLIVDATLPSQRMLNATLGTLSAAVRAADLASPALLIAGDVASLQPALSWFGSPQNEHLSRSA